MCEEKKFNKDYRMQRNCSHHISFICFFFVLANIGPYDKDEIYDPRPTERPYPYPPRPDNRPDYPRPDYRPDNRPDQRDNIPQKYKTAVGDGTKLSCEIENYNARTSWRRQDGQPLPSNARLSGGDLVKFTEKNKCKIEKKTISTT